MRRLLICLALATPLMVAAGPAGAQVPEACSQNPDPEKQVTACSDYLDKNPRSAEAYNDRGFAFARLQNLRAAISDFDVAIKLNPKLIHAYNNRGISLRLAGRNDDALNDFSKTIEIDPKYILGYIGRGISLMLKNDLEGAAKDFDQAIKVDPKFASSYRNRGNVALRQQMFQDAIQYYNQALVLDITDADAYHNRAIAYEALGSPRVAIMNYKLALKYNPDLEGAKKALERLGQ